MPITKAEDVADHGHHCQASRVVCPTLEPHLRILALNPENGLQVLAQGLLESMAEDFNLIGKWTNVKVFTEALHQVVIDAGNNLVLLAMLFDQHM